MQTSSLKHCKVLVVLDRQTELDQIGPTLSEALPCEFILTTDTGDALQILQKEEIAVLLSDMELSEYNGPTLHQAAIRHNASIVTILLLGSHQTHGSLSAISDLGIWEYLIKPWTPEQLTETVRQGLMQYDEMIRRQETLRELARDSVTIIRDARVEEKQRTPRISIKQNIPIHLARKRLFSSRAKSTRRGPARCIDKRYRVEKLLSRGGHGIIYKAHDQLLDMPVAIKVLSDRFKNEDEALRQLCQEARTALQLSHKHIIRLHNLQQNKGRLYLVMEFIDGFTLADRLDTMGPMSWKAVLQTAMVCSDALSYAHRRGIYHRDLKPSNLMLNQDGVLKIIDFGMACLSESNRRKNYIQGTPCYISPEEMRGDPLDQRVDVYSFAIALHELLTGKLPFPPMAKTQDILNMDPVVSTEIEEPINHILQKAMDPNRERRWYDMESFVQALWKVSPLD